MRIGLTCTTIESVLTNGQLDGIGTYTKKLYENLIAQGENIVPYSFPNSDKNLKSDFENGQFFSSNYTKSTVASFLSPTNRHKNIAKNIDIFHATDHMLPKIKNLPVVATICDAIMFKHADWHFDTIRLGNLKKWARKKTIHWADHYITISHAMVPELVEHIGIKEENISVIYLGVDNIWFEKTSAKVKQKIREKYNLPEKFILCTGTIQHKKNLARTIKAYLKLPKDVQDEYPLIIIGRKGWGIKESMAAIKELTSNNKGKWLDYVEFDELLAIFQMASLYLHASLHEGFGLTLLEAFASETPVVTSNITALPEVAGDAAVLVDPLSVDDIKNGVLKVLTDESLQGKLITKGRLRARLFSWDKCAKETLKVYKGLT